MFPGNGQPLGLAVKNPVVTFASLVCELALSGDEPTLHCAFVELVVELVLFCVSKTSPSFSTAVVSSTSGLKSDTELFSGRVLLANLDSAKLSIALHTKLSA